MPKSTGELEQRVIKAYETARLEKKPILAKIAREYTVNCVAESARENRLAAPIRLSIRPLMSIKRNL
jgi:hypothetical protein